MEKIEKTLRYVALFHIYKSQLSSSQQEIIYDYYFLDLSISEIAENRDISRAAVEDALRKGSKKLDSLEEEMKIYERSENLRQKLDILRQKALNSHQVEEIENLLKELDYGI